MPDDELGRSHDGALHGRHALAHAPDEALSHVAMAVAEFQRLHPLRARAHLREALRLDPDSDTEEAFMHVDMLTRWPGLPFYWWSILADRLPGKQFTIWIAVMLSLRGASM